MKKGKFTYIKRRFGGKCSFLNVKNYNALYK